MKKKLFIYSFLSIIVIGFYSCKDDDADLESILPREDWWEGDDPCHEQDFQKPDIVYANYGENMDIIWRKAKCSCDTFHFTYDLIYWGGGDSAVSIGRFNDTIAHIKKSMLKPSDTYVFMVYAYYWYLSTKRRGGEKIQIYEPGITQFIDIYKDRRDLEKFSIEFTNYRSLKYSNFVFCDVDENNNIIKKYKELNNVANDDTILFYINSPLDYYLDNEYSESQKTWQTFIEEGWSGTIYCQFYNHQDLFITDFTYHFDGDDAPNKHIPYPIN